MTLLVACGLRREAAIIARAGVVPVAGGGVAQALEDTLEDMIASEAWNFSAVLSCGVAGALDPALQAGDVVIGDLHSTRFPGSALVEWLAHHLPEARRGAVVGADAIIASVAEKATLYARTGAIAVDMESHIAARVAARHNLPFAILRTISDSADHALPPAALVGMTPDGNVALGAILKSLAQTPAQLPALIRTGRDAGAAFRSLRRALSTLEALGIGRLDAGEFGLDIG